eukprot:7485514-Pyramimonas_sp.AAC.1
MPPLSTPVSPLSTSGNNHLPNTGIANIPGEDARRLGENLLHTQYSYGCEVVMRTEVRCAHVAGVDVVSQKAMSRLQTNRPKTAPAGMPQAGFW